MTKNELIFIASDIDLMDKLNTISGLMEINAASDKELIDSLVDDIYESLQLNRDKMVANPKGNKLYYLNEISKIDPEKAKKMEKLKLSEIRYIYNKLTNQLS